MDSKNSNSIIERLTYLGVATFFLWPIVHICLLKSFPVNDKTIALRASYALQNIMEKALAGSHKPTENTNFEPIKGFEELGLESKTDIFMHPDYKNQVIIKAYVKWGEGIFTKIIDLEQTVPVAEGESIKEEIIPLNNDKFLKEIDAIALELSNATNIDINVGESLPECSYKTVDGAFDSLENATKKIIEYNGVNVSYKITTQKGLEEKKFDKFDKNILNSCRNIKFSRLSNNLLKMSFTMPNSISDETVTKLIYLRNVK